MGGKALVGVACGQKRLGILLLPQGLAPVVVTVEGGNEAETQFLSGAAAGSDEGGSVGAAEGA